MQDPSFIEIVIPSAVLGLLAYKAWQRVGHLIPKHARALMGWSMAVIAITIAISGNVILADRNVSPVVIALAVVGFAGSVTGALALLRN